LLDLVVDRQWLGDRQYTDHLTKTGCTTETSFREGAGWYRGDPSPDCGWRESFSPRLKPRLSDMLEDIDSL